LKEINTMNSNPYGKLMINVQRIPFYKFSGKVFVQIELDPYVLNTAEINFGDHLEWN